MLLTNAFPARATSAVTTWRLGLTGLAGLSLASSLVLSGCGKGAEAQGGPPPAAAVSVAPAVQRTVANREEFSGRLEATEFVELRPRVAGTIDRVYFTDGSTVRKGDLLFQIDPRPFDAELSRAQSQLDATKARMDLAQTELGRAKTLLDSQAVSKQEFDQLTSGSRTSQADLRSAEAAVRTAQLNLAYTQVRAPIAGRVSRANITAGNLVNEQAVLTTIAGVGRVYAYFDGSEQTYLRLQAEKAAKPGGKGPVVRMGLANEAGHPHEGVVDFVDNRLNPQTGAIRLRASFDNSKGLFTPGLAARVVMESSADYSAVMVPDRAIGTDQTKKFVYVVGADGQPQFREVKPGALFGGMRVVQGSVKAGENVVVDGLQRIIPGMPVAPQVLQVDAQGMPIVPPPASAASPSPAASSPKN